MPPGAGEGQNGPGKGSLSCLTPSPRLEAQGPLHAVSLPRGPCGSGVVCWLTVHERLCPVWAVLFLFAPAWQPRQLHPRPKSQSPSQGGLALVVSVAARQAAMHLALNSASLTLWLSTPRAE